MRWFWWHPERNRMLGLVAMLGALGFLMIHVPNQLNRPNGAHAGFGPDWDCVSQARGDPVCIRKLDK